MSLPLTREMLAAAYDFLCTTPPFSHWNMPPSEEIDWRITRNPKTLGYYVPRNDGRHIIAISARCISRTHALVEIMAHEMVHLYQREAKMETPNVGHNKAFRKLADRVCKIHGFDPGLF